MCLYLCPCGADPRKFGSVGTEAGEGRRGRGKEREGTQLEEEWTSSTKALCNSIKLKAFRTSDLFGGKPNLAIMCVAEREGSNCLVLKTVASLFLPIYINYFSSLLVGLNVEPCLSFFFSVCLH